MTKQASSFGLCLVFMHSLLVGRRRERRGKLLSILSSTFSLGIHLLYGAKEWRYKLGIMLAKSLVVATCSSLCFLDLASHS